MSVTRREREFSNTLLDDLLDIIQQLDHNKPIYKGNISTYLKSLQKNKLSRVRTLLDVVENFGGASEEEININRINSALEDSKKWRNIFRSLQCRGFSFQFCENPLNSMNYLNSHINIKTALIIDRNLYYPPMVRNALRTFSPEKIHVPNGIGWILATEQQICGKKWWFILNIQSDLMSTQVSALKEIFRGWQRVLFKLTVQLAHRHEASVIAIPSVKTVIKTRILTRIPYNRSTPENWWSLYDGTAEFFGMQRSMLCRPIDVRTLGVPQWSSEFSDSIGFSGKITSH
jgi:hypothetical protein